MITWDILCPPEKNCPISLIWIFFYMFYLFSWPKLLIPPSLTLRAWVGITKTGEKLLLTHKWKNGEEHESPLPILQIIFQFFTLTERGAWGKILPWRILCDRSFQFACLSLCKMWDMRDINTLPRYPCLHPSPILPHVVPLIAHRLPPTAPRVGWRSIWVLGVLCPPRLW